MQDPQPTEWCQGSNPCPQECQSGSLLLSHNGNSTCVYIYLLYPAFLLSFSGTLCPGFPASDTHVWPPHPCSPPWPWPGIPLMDSFMHWILFNKQWPCPHDEPGPLSARQPSISRLRGPTIGTTWPQLLAGRGEAGEEGHAGIRGFSLYKLPLRCSSDWSSAGTHVLTCNAGPGQSWGNCDNQSGCHSGRKCSFTTLRPGAIIYYAFRQREPRQLEHGAAVSAISHHSPSQPFVPCSLGWIITGGTAHFSEESLLFSLSANASQFVPSQRL